MEYGLGSGRGQSLHICTGRIGGVHNASAKFVPKPKRALDLAEITVIVRSLLDIFLIN